jgi:hypothetical protein
MTGVLVLLLELVILFFGLAFLVAAPVLDPVLLGAAVATCGPPIDRDLVRLRRRHGDRRWVDRPDGRRRGTAVSTAQVTKPESTARVLGG